MMECPYSETYQGVKICSNVPLNSIITTGHHISMNLHFGIPLTNYLISILSELTPEKIIVQLEKYTGMKEIITNWKISPSGLFDLNVDFDVQSPQWQLIVIAIIIIAIITGIGIIGYFLNSITLTVSKNPALSVGAGAIGVALALGIGVLALVYWDKYRRSRK